ncbi:MAG: 50S ribosomal protein L22 [Rickettsiales bacterium]|jgi:large subunit ribosomal protein L22|nr:50S ribosomal protein L22 [Rickettsiales bacterium]
MAEKYNIKENQARAFDKMIRVSHQKLGLVIDTIRGLPVAKAVDVLKFSKKRVAGHVLKVLMSAIANAEHNKKLPADSLFVREIWCGKSITMKRVYFGGMTQNGAGGVRHILKPFSNLTIIVESGAAPEKKKEVKKTEVKKETKKK